MEKNNNLEKHEIYNKLAKERDRSKSETLHNLLNKEISAYLELTNTYFDFAKLYQFISVKHNKLRKKYISEPIEIIKRIEDQNFAKVALDSIYNRNEGLNTLEVFYDFLFNLLTENYYKVIDRDFKDWSEFVKKSCEVFADVVTSVVPGMAEAEAIFDNYMKINELVNELEKDEIDYSDIDKKLLQIESHIKVMSSVKELYSQSMEILKDGVQFK